jgi:hypothetical protein
MKRLVLCLIALPAPGLADANIGGKTVDCYCTDKSGARIEMGEVICLEVDGRMFTAQCQMSLNVPMWRELRDGCLSTQVTPQMTPMPDTASRSG